MPLFAGASLPYETDFETSEGYYAGPLASGTWSILDWAWASISQGNSASGLQHLRLAGPGWLSFESDSSPQADVQWVDFYVDPVFWELESLPQGFETEHSAVVAFARDGQDGYVYAVDGDGQGSGVWRVAGQPLSISSNMRAGWVRLSYRLDHQRKVWDLYVNGEPKLPELGFLDNSVGRLNQVALGGGSSGATRMDFFYVGPDNPIEEDTSGDGIPDSWLISKGLNPNLYQRDGDPDRDGLTNLWEYFLGLNPLNSDTDGDGMDDGLEVLLGHQPATSEAHDLATFHLTPFFESFETGSTGTFTGGAAGWTISGSAPVVATGTGLPHGSRYLMSVENDTGIGRYFKDPNKNNVVWVDMYAKAAYHHWEDEGDPFSPRATSLFYFGSDGRLRVLDGDGAGGGTWEVVNHPPVQPEAWVRLTLRQSYSGQNWSIWVNGVRYRQNLGFRDKVPSFSFFGINGLRQVDAIRVTVDPITGLDDDGDGLSNEDEVLYGTNPSSPDSSGDGMVDGDKVLLGLNPTSNDSMLAKLVADGQGGYTWQVSFDGGDGYAGGTLSGQHGWQGAAATVASDGTVLLTGSGSSDSWLRHYFGVMGHKRLWVSFRAKLQAGPLPSVPQNQPVSAVFGYPNPVTISVYNGATESWEDYRYLASAPLWNDYEVYLDYEARTWALYVNGLLVSKDIPMVANDLSAFSLLSILQAAVVSGNGAAPDFALDSLAVSTRRLRNP